MDISLFLFTYFSINIFNISSYSKSPYSYSLTILSFSLNTLTNTNGSNMSRSHHATCSIYIFNKRPKTLKLAGFRHQYRSIAIGNEFISKFPSKGQSPGFNSEQKRSLFHHQREANHSPSHRHRQDPSISPQPRCRPLKLFYDSIFWLDVI